MKNIISKAINTIKSNYTIMVIPNSTKKSLQITIPKVLVFFILFLNFSYISISLINNYNLSKSEDLLTSKLNSKIKKIEYYESYTKNLKADVQNQLNDVKELKAKLDNEKELYSQRLDKLESLEKDFVYILDKFNYNNNLNIEVASSRSLKLGRDSLKPIKENKKDDFIDLIDIDINNYNDAIEKIDEKMEFLECKPDLIPVNGTITSGFGYRIHPITKMYDFHDGIDISEKNSTPIKAAGAGIVTFNGRNGSYGNVLIISHGYGYKTVYAHNSKNLIKVGSEVKKGQVIAKIGTSGTATGPHVHFEIHKDGKIINPLKVISLD